MLISDVINFFTQYSVETAECLKRKCWQQLLTLASFTHPGKSGREGENAAFLPLVFTISPQNKSRNDSVTLPNPFKLGLKALFHLYIFFMRKQIIDILWKNPNEMIWEL